MQHPLRRLGPKETAGGSVMRAAVSFLYCVLLVILALSGIPSAAYDAVPAQTGKGKVLSFNTAQMAAFQHRAEAGDSQAQFILGCAYRDGGPILPQNQAEAVKWFRKAADQGFAKAENELGNMYLDGRGIPQ